MLAQAVSVGAAGPPVPPPRSPPGITIINLAAGERPVPPPPAPPAYVDRLIEGVAPDQDPATAAEPGDQSPGLRVWSTEFFLDHRDVGGAGSTISPGVALRHRRETERLGDFTLEADVTRWEPSASEPRRTRGRFTLFHDQYAVSDSSSASSVVGTWRSAFSPWLASSYRVHLPSSLATGAFTMIASPTSEFRAGIGRLGRMAGTSVQGFEFLDGTVANLEYSTQLPGNALVGGGLVSFRGSRNVADHTAATIATEVPVTLPSLDGRVKFQAAVDDHGETGFWADGRLNAGRISHRVGAFRMSPDLQFGEITPQRDSQGLYWRADVRGSTLSVNAGVDATSSNLDRVASKGGSDSTGGYGNLSLRLDRSTSVGAGASYREDRPRTGPGATYGKGTVNGWASRVTSWGTSRIDGSLTRTTLAGRAETSRAYSWSHDWPRLAGAVAMDTLVTFTDERIDGRKVRRTSASVGLNGDLFGSLGWSASLTGVDVDDGGESERNYNSSVSLDWQPSSEWVVRLQWQRNQIQPAATNAAAPFLRDNTVMLSARYEATAGTPYPRVAAVGGRSGTGTIAGALFYDENKDGSRQPTEAGAAGVAVLLNGRQVQMTDSQGRFAFTLVPPGEHRVSIAVDRIPLPWGLEDDAPRRVRVELREDARIDIGLTRIQP